MSAETHQYIIKDFENSHSIWFQKTKSFLLLEEPAFVVFEGYKNGNSVDEIIDICQKKYGHLEENISAFVYEIIEHIKSYNNPNNKVSLSRKMDFVDSSVSCSNNAIVVYYKVGEKELKISYADQAIKFAIHPIIAHLETDNVPKVAEIIDCIERNGTLVLKYNKELVEAFDKENIEYFTGAVKQLLISIVHKKKYYEWMTMLHASGVTHNDKAILFSAASGSGKSTISAILKAKGYGYIADDFIAADKEGKAFAFPDAISVKKGAFNTLSEYYPELLETNEQETFIGKTVRYLPITNNPAQAVMVKAFIFVNYSNSEEFIFEEVDKKTALQLLLKETWVNPESEFVSAFFEWIENTVFYRLQYSEMEDAESVVQRIIEQ